MSLIRFVAPPALLVASLANAQLPPDSAQRATPRGFAIGVVDSANSALSEAPSLAHALQARLPGVSVSLGEGVLGSSARVWLRGATSAVLNEPLLIIDGVRTHTANPNRGFVDQELPSRLEDLDMETVERIEILRGPAAAAVYGPGASKGVILVTTKRGNTGPVRWTAFAESGPSIEPTDFPTNYGRLGISTSNGSPVTSCSLIQEASGSCTPTVQRSWNPLESASPFRTGWTNGAGLSASGGVRSVRYHAAASHDRANGVYETDHSRATSAHLNLAASPTSTLDLRLSGGYRADRLRHPAESIIEAGLFGSSVDDPVGRGYANGSYAALMREERAEHVDRTTVGLGAIWRPQAWLQAGFSAGYDRLGVESALRVRRPRLTFHEPTADSVTTTEQASDRPETRSATLDATMSYAVRGVPARTSFGVQYIRDDDRGRSSRATQPDAGGGGSAFQSSFEFERESTGLYLQQQIAWSDRFFLGGTVRADHPMGDVGVLDDIISTSADASWTVLGATRAPTLRGIDMVRLRGAYGRGGDHIIAAEGRPSPETSERGAELEVGVDASVLADRVHAGVTYSRATTRRGLIRYPFVTPYLGNLAGIRSWGMEAAVDARVLETASMRWDMGLTYTVHRSTIESLEVAPFAFENQVVRPGEPLGAYYATPYSYDDTDGDGLLAPSEVIVLMGGYQRVGSPLPDYEAGVHTSMSIGRVATVSALLDRRSGGLVHDQLARFRCFTGCRERYDPAASLADQARSVAAFNGTEVGYLDDRSYTRLREVRMALALPESVARMGGAARARVTFTGRNLYTWTSHRGLDPELGGPSPYSAGPGLPARQPLLRSFIARLDLTW